MIKKILSVELLKDYRDRLDNILYIPPYVDIQIFNVL